MLHLPIIINLMFSTDNELRRIVRKVFAHLLTSVAALGYAVSVSRTRLHVFGVLVSELVYHPLRP